jgi:hypothetical protein
MGWSDDDDIAYHGPNHSYSWDQQRLNITDDDTAYHYDGSGNNESNHHTSPLFASQPLLVSNDSNNNSGGGGVVQAFAETLDRLNASLENDVELERVIRQAKQQLQAAKTSKHVVDSTISRPDQRPPFEFQSESSTASDFTHHQRDTVAAMDSHYPFQSRHTSAAASFSEQ